MTRFSLFQALRFELLKIQPVAMPHTYYAVVSRDGQLRADGIGQSPMIALSQFTWASRLTWEQAVEFGYRMHEITVEIGRQLNVIVDRHGNVIIIRDMI